MTQNGILKDSIPLCSKEIRFSLCSNEIRVPLYSNEIRFPVCSNEMRFPLCSNEMQVSLWSNEFRLIFSSQELPVTLLFDIYPWKPTVTKEQYLYMFKFRWLNFCTQDPLIEHKCMGKLLYSSYAPWQVDINKSSYKSSTNLFTTLMSSGTHILKILTHKIIFLIACIVVSETYWAEAAGVTHIPPDSGYWPLESGSIFRWPCPWNEAGFLHGDTNKSTYGPQTTNLVEILKKTFSSEWMIWGDVTKNFLWVFYTHTYISYIAGW